MDQTENKHYPFQFTNQMIFIFAVALLLCAACFGVSTWRFVGFLQSGDLASFYSWLQYIILYLVSILLAVLITAMLIRSRYTVTEKQIILQFGLIKSKYEIKSIYSIHLFRDRTNSLFTSTTIIPNTPSLWSTAPGTTILSKRCWNGNRASNSPFPQPKKKPPKRKNNLATYSALRRQITEKRIGIRMPILFPFPGKDICQVSQIRAADHSAAVII